jgi:hypothetical protein
VGAISDHVLGTSFFQCGGGVAQGSGRIDDVVNQDAEAPANVADNIHDFRLAGALAALVDDRERRVVEPFGE